MSRKAFAFFVLAVFASFAVACGGSNPPPIDEGPGDMGQDLPGIDIGHDVVEDEGQPDVEPDVRPDVDEEVGVDVNPGDSVEVTDEGGSQDVDVDTADVPEEIVVIDFCPCDQNVNEPVCSTDNVTYKNAQCAACAMCAPDPVNCPDCEGDIDCQGDADNFIKRRTSCGVCPCILQDECERQAQPIEQCKEVCAVDGVTEYQDLCAFKTAMDCEDDYDDQIGYFGECAEPMCPLKDGTGNCGNDSAPICGSDGQTYTNKCWLGNCPSAEGVTKACDGECPCM